MSTSRIIHIHLQMTMERQILLKHDLRTIQNHLKMKLNKKMKMLS